MLKLRCLSVFFVFLCFLSTTTFSNDLPKTTLTKLKKATVFIKARSGSGTGFLTKKNIINGYIVTNAHVVGKTEAVDVIFDSGLKGEFKLTGDVVALDEELDLAVIKIEHGNLPSPLDVLGIESKYKATMPVYVLGFPFGKMLADSAAKNPSVTIHQGIVTSLRKNDDGVLSRIQMDADINPGNSGGPIVNEKGEVIAVAVSGYLGTQVEFGIPGSRLVGFLSGNIRSFKAATKQRVNGKAVIKTETVVNDPFKYITHLKLVIVPQTSVNTDLLKPNSSNRYSPIISDKSQYSPITLKGGNYIGDVSIKAPDGKDVPCYYQYMITKKNKKNYYSKPKEYYLMNISKDLNNEATETGYSAVERTAVENGLKISYLTHKLGSGQSTVLSRDGLYCYILHGDLTNIIYKLHLKSLKIVQSYSVGDKARNIALSENKLLVSIYNGTGKAKKGILFLKENSLSRDGFLSLDDNPYCVIAHPENKYAYAFDRRNTTEILVIDTASKRLVKKLQTEKELKIPKFSTINDAAISPDGKFIYCIGSSRPPEKTVADIALYTYKISSSNLVLAKKPFDLPDDLSKIILTKDGKYLAVISDKTKIYSTNNLSKELASLNSRIKPFWGGVRIGIAIDNKRKCIYAGDQIYNMDGILQKDIIPYKFAGIRLFSPDQNVLLLKSIGLVYVDLNAQSGPEAGSKKNQEDTGWLGKGDEERTEPAELRSVGKTPIKKNDAVITEINIPSVNITGDICWSSDGKSFFVAQKGGTIHKISFPGLLEEKVVELNTDIYDIKVSKSGLVALTPKNHQLLLLDEKDLKIKKKIPTPEAYNIMGSKNLDVIYSIIKSKLAIIDLNKGGIVKTLDTFKTEGEKGNRVGANKSFNSEKLFVTEKGKYLLCLISFPKMLARFEIRNGGLDLEFEQGRKTHLHSSYHSPENSNFISEYQTSVTSGTKPTIKILNIGNIANPILEVIDSRCVGIDEKLNKIYNVDPSGIKVLDAQGTLLNEYSVNLTPTRSYKHSGKKHILIHPEGGSCLVSCSGYFYKFEIPPKPGPKPWPKVEEVMTAEPNIYSHSLKFGSISAYFYKYNLKRNAQVGLSIDGKGFYLLSQYLNNNDQVIKKLNFNGEILAAADIKGSLCGVSKFGPVVRDKTQFKLLDLNTLKIKTTIPIEEYNVRSCFSPKLEIGILSYKNRVEIIDLNTGKTVKKISPQSLLSPKNPSKKRSDIHLVLTGITENGERLISATTSLFIDRKRLLLSKKTYCNKTKSPLGIFGNYVAFLEQTFTSNNNGKTYKNNLELFDAGNMRKPKFSIPLEIGSGKIINIDMDKKIIYTYIYSPNKKGLFALDFKGKVLEKFQLPDYLDLNTKDLISKNMMERECRIVGHANFFTLVDFNPNPPKITIKQETEITDSTITDSTKSGSDKTGGETDNNSVSNKTDEDSATSTDSNESNKGESIVKERKKELDAEIITFTEMGHSLVPAICLSSNQKYFFILNKKGLLKKISQTEFKVVARLDLKQVASYLQQSKQGLLAACPLTSQLFVIDESNLQIKKKIYVPNIQQVSSNIHSNIAVFTHRDKRGVMTFINLENGKVSDTYRLKDLMKGQYSVFTTYPPDLTPKDELFFQAHSHIVKFKIGASGLQFVSMSPKIPSGDFSSMAVSVDGKYVAANIQTPYRQAIYSNRPTSSKPHIPGGYLYRGDKLESPISISRLCLPTAIDVKLGLIYSDYMRICDLRTGIPIRSYNLGGGRISPVYGEKAAFFGGKRGELSFIRWGLPLSELPKPTKVNNKITGKISKDKDITATELKVDDPSDIIPKCCWVPDSNGIIIANYDGKISKIDLSTGIETNTLLLKSKIADIAISKEGVLVSIPSLQQIIILSPEDLSVKSRIDVAFMGYKLFSRPNLDYAFLFSANIQGRGDVSLLNLKTKKIEQSIYAESVKNGMVSPSGKTFYIKTNTLLYVNSFDGKELKNKFEIQCPPFMMGDNKDISISDDEKYLAVHPQYHSQPIKGLRVSKYTVLIYKTSLSGKYVTYIDTGKPVRAIAFDSKSECIYANVETADGEQLGIKSGNRIITYEFMEKNSRVKKIFVHPKGNNFIILTDKQLIWCVKDK